jgi:hypothetical protein
MRPRPLLFALALALGPLACFEAAPPPKPLSSFGQPLPTASTTAEPLWLRTGGTAAPSRPEGAPASSARSPER